MQRFEELEEDAGFDLIEELFNLEGRGRACDLNVSMTKNVGVNVDDFSANCG